MSINADNPFSFDTPGLMPPQDQDPTTNQGQSAVVAKQTHGQGTGATTLAHDTIQSGGETVSTQQFSNLDQSALNAVIPQQPVLPQLDTTTSPATLFAVSELIITSGFAVPTEQTPSSSDEVHGESEGSPSGTVSDGSMALPNPMVQKRNKKDQGSSQGEGDFGSDIPAAAPAGSAKAPAGSDWLKPSGYVTAMINMLSYVNDSTRQETTLLKLTIAMINIMWDMTLTAAQLQREIGKKEAQMYYVAAAMAAVQMAVAVCTVAFTVGAMGVAAGGMGKEIKELDPVTNTMKGTGKYGPDSALSRSAQMVLNSNLLTQIGTIVNSGTDMVGNIAKAQITIAKANLEAALKEEEGRITQMKMLLDQMMQSLENLHSLVDQFNRYIAEISKQRGDSLGISRAS